MPEMVVGPVAAAAMANEINAACPLLGGLNIQIQNFESRLTNALEAAADKILEDKKAEAKTLAQQDDRRSDADADVSLTEAVQPEVTGSADSSGETQPADDPVAPRIFAGDVTVVAPGDEVLPERDKVVEQGAENVKAEEQVQSRVSEIVGRYRVELVRRAADLDLLSDGELTAFAKSLLEDRSLNAAWEAQKDALAQQAGDAHDLLARIAGRLTEGPPSAAAAALADHISTNVVPMVSAADADPMAVDFLACERTASIDQLIGRSIDPALDAGAQRAAAFDAHLAMAYSERLLKEQVSDAWAAVKADLAQLPERSAARNACEAFLAIAEKIPEADVETRGAAERYYEALADSKSHPVAREVLDRLLNSRDELLFDYLVKLDREATSDPRLAQALCADEDISARARRQLAEADSGDVKERPRRIAPFDEIPSAKTNEFHLLKVDLLEAVHYELLKMEAVVEAVTMHAEARLRNTLVVLELVNGLKQQGVIERDTPVAVGRALYQLGRGSQEEDSEAAHKLAGQLYLGVDQETLATLDEEQRCKYRLDTLLQFDSELEMLARIQAASTSVLPSCVNKVDSLCESKGLRDAFEQSVRELLDQDAWSPNAVTQAYETFRAGAIEALDAARAHIAKTVAAERLDADRAAESLYHAQLQRRQEVIDAYEIVLKNTDADRAYTLMQDWMRIALARDNDK